MANNEHVVLLEQGVEAWNAWRQSNPGIKERVARHRVLPAWYKQEDNQ